MSDEPNDVAQREDRLGADDGVASYAMNAGPRLHDKSAFTEQGLIHRRRFFVGALCTTLLAVAGLGVSIVLG